MRVFLSVLCLTSCATTRELPLDPALKGPCPETASAPISVVPASPSPRRIAVSIETVGSTSGATTPVCPSSVAYFRTAVVQALLAAGLEPVVLPVSATPSDVATVGASKVLRGLATITSHEPDSFMKGLPVFLVDGSYSLSLLDGEQRVLATATGSLHRKRKGLPFISFDRSAFELVQDNEQQVMQPLLGALAAP